MLLSLSIRQIVLIESLDIHFGAGLCVLTGETGAGKSILLDALGFVLGERASARLLRHGAAQGSVTAEFAVGEHAHISRFLEEQGLQTEGSALYMRRVIYEDGRSKAFVNDAQVTVQLLKNLGEMLVEIHGQHEQRGLMESATHRSVLDAYAGLYARLHTLKESYQQWKQAERQLEALTQAEADALREQDYLRYVVDELESLAPEAGEESLLAEKRKNLLGREKRIELLKQVLQLLQGSSSVQEQLLEAEKLLMRKNDVLEEKQVQPVMEAFERASLEIGEAERQLEILMRAENGEHEDVEQIEERLFGLKAAARKYHCTVDELSDVLEKSRSKLATITRSQEQKEALRIQIARYRKEYTAQAEAVSLIRKESAATLEQALMAELVPLKMGSTVFKVMLEQMPEKEWSDYGWDKTIFLATMNPGQPLAPLTKIASGGELSRFMLAIKVVLSGVDRIPVMIFDEVDTGIGGAVAAAVGKRLSLLGKTTQLLVVTHQPQVAAYGEHHLKVRKETADGHTVTKVQVLEREERQEELARMLSGSEITEEARAAAEKLMRVEEDKTNC